MGSSQSCPVAHQDTQQLLADRLDNVEMHNKVVQIRQTDMEAGYVDVDLDRESTLGASDTVSIAVTEEWEKQLLSDPKVCLFKFVLRCN